MSEKKNPEKLSLELMEYGIERTVLGIPGVNRLKDLKIIQDKKDDDKSVINIFLTVDYGANIPQLAWEIQKAVKQKTESLMNLKVKAVNINVEGVMFPKGEDK